MPKIEKHDSLVISRQMFRAECAGERLRRIIRILQSRAEASKHLALAQTCSKTLRTTPTEGSHRAHGITRNAFATIKKITGKYAMTDTSPSPQRETGRRKIIKPARLSNGGKGRGAFPQPVSATELTGLAESRRHGGAKSRLPARRHVGGLCSNGGSAEAKDALAKRLI